VPEKLSLIEQIRRLRVLLTNDKGTMHPEEAANAILSLI